MPSHIFNTRLRENTRVHCRAPPNIFFLHFFPQNVAFFSYREFQMLHPTTHCPSFPARLREIKLFLPGNFTSPPALDENTAGCWPSPDSVQRPGTSHSWRLKSCSQSQPSYCLSHKCTSRPLSSWQMEHFAPHFEMSRVTSFRWKESGRI